MRRRAAESVLRLCVAVTALTAAWAAWERPTVVNGLLFFDLGLDEGLARAVDRGAAGALALGGLLVLLRPWRWPAALVLLWLVALASSTSLRSDGAFSDDSDTFSNDTFIFSGTRRYLQRRRRHVQRRHLQRRQRHLGQSAATGTIAPSATGAVLDGLLAAAGCNDHSSAGVRAGRVGGAARAPLPAGAARFGGAPQAGCSCWGAARRWSCPRRSPSCCEHGDIQARAWRRDPHADAARDEAGDAVTETVELTPREVNWIEESRWPQSPVALSSLGVAFTVESRVLAVAADSPAARAGIQPGDTVTRARFVKAGEKAGPDDQGVELSPESPSWPFVMAMLQQSPDDTRLSLTVAAADGLARDVELAPVASDTAFVVDRGLIFKPVYRLVQAGSVGAALSKGLSKTGEDLSVVYRFLQKVTSNQISPRLLGGPIEIAKQAGKSAEEGLGRLLLFLTMLSANLAVINFLPVPVLDGGHMVFLLYELVRGKPPSEKVVEGLSYLGLLLLLSLMLFVFGLDLGLIPRR
jgi:hypothetical protein